MLGDYYVYASNAVNHRGELFNDKTGRFDPRYRIVGLKHGRSEKTLVWRELTKRIKKQGFERGYFVVHVDRHTFTNTDERTILPVPFPIKSLSNSGNLWILNLHGRPKPVPKGVVSAVLDTAEQDKTFIDWIKKFEEGYRMSEAISIEALEKQYMIIHVCNANVYCLLQKNGVWSPKLVGPLVQRVLCVQEHDGLNIFGEARLFSKLHLVGYKVDIELETVTPIKITPAIEALLRDSQEV